MHDDEAVKALLRLRSPRPAFVMFHQRVLFEEFCTFGDFPLPSFGSSRLISGYRHTPFAILMFNQTTCYHHDGCVGKYFLPRSNSTCM
jgi:hypothetical protein